MPSDYINLLGFHPPQNGPAIDAAVPHTWLFVISRTDKGGPPGIALRAFWKRTLWRRVAPDRVQRSVLLSAQESTRSVWVRRSGGSRLQPAEKPWRCCAGCLACCRRWSAWRTPGQRPRAPGWKSGSRGCGVARQRRRHATCGAALAFNNLLRLDLESYGRPAMALLGQGDHWFPRRNAMRSIQERF